MIFSATSIPGAFVVRAEPHHDERGFFARIWCREEFAIQGISFNIAQASVSHNRHAGTLRGLHFAWPPAEEGKLVRCVRGRIFDVVLDLRPQSLAFLKHFSIELDQDELGAVYIPPGVAHGFQTLMDDSQVHYIMSEAYRPELVAGVRHDDAAFAVRWPKEVTVISERDRTYPDFDRVSHAERFMPATLAKNCA